MYSVVALLYNSCHYGICNRKYLHTSHMLILRSHNPLTLQFIVINNQVYVVNNIFQRIYFVGRCMQPK